jgi:hypothetical protein
MLFTHHTSPHSHHHVNTQCHQSHQTQHKVVSASTINTSIQLLSTHHSSQHIDISTHNAVTNTVTDTSTHNTSTHQHNFTNTPKFQRVNTLTQSLGINTPTDQHSHQHINTHQRTSTHQQINTLARQNSAHQDVNTH